MKIKSASNPTSSKLAVGRDTIYISEISNISISRDKVLNASPPTGFTVTNVGSGYTPTVDQGGLKLTKLPTGGNYSITNNETVNSDLWAFETKFRMVPDIANISADVSFQRFYVDSVGTQGYTFDTIYSYLDESMKVIVSYYSEATESTEYLEVYDYPMSVGDSLDCTFQIIHQYGKVNLYIVDHRTHEWRMIHGIDIAFSGSVTTKISAVDSSSLATGHAIWFHVLNMPTLEGVYGFNVDLQYQQHPVNTSRSLTEVSFACVIDALSDDTTSATMWGTGAFIGAGYQHSFLYEKTAYNLPEDQWSFMISQLENYEVEGDTRYDCPDIVAPDTGSIGDILVNVNCCFPDGTLSDVTPFKIRGAEFGRVGLNADLAHSPKFFFEDETENKFGCGFDFQQFFHKGIGDTSLLLADDSFRISFLKSRLFDESKRVYYGVQVDPMLDATRSYFFDLDYTFSATQQLDMGTPYDLFYWEIKKEDGTSVQSSGVDIDVTNYVANVPVASSLTQGRYFLEVGAYNLEGASIIGIVYKGTTNADPVVGKCLAESKTLNTEAGYQPLEYGVSRIHFEVREEVGALVAYIFDPTSVTPYVKREDVSYTVDMLGQSLGCFQNTAGNLVFVYKKLTGSTSYESQSDKLYYKTLNVTTGVFSAEGVIWLPISLENGSYVHSFDVGNVTANTLDLFASIGNNEDYREVNGVTRSISCRPMGQALVKFSLSIQGLGFTGDDVTILNYDIADLPISSINNLWKNCRADAYFGTDANLWERLFFADTVRVVRDQEQEIDIVSMIDIDTRTPLVMMGNGTHYKEISVPFHFESKDYIEQQTSFTAISYHQHLSLKIDSLSATLGHDGMVYSAATQGEICEIGLIDPSLYWDTRNEVIKPQILRTSGSGTSIDIWRPDFRFENLQTLSLGYSLESAGKCVVDINTFQHYMNISVGNNRFISYPMIYQNGTITDFGYEASMERQVVGSHGYELPAWIDEQQAIYGTFSVEDGVRLKSLGNDIYTSTYFKMIMQDSTVYHHQHLKLDDGYRFSTRVGCVLQPATFSLERPFYFYGHGMGYLDPTDLSGFLTSAQARMVYYGNYVICQVWFAKTTAWVTVKSIDLDVTKIYDFDIIMKRTSGNKAKFGFVVRTPRNVVDGQEHVFISDLVGYHFEHYWVIETGVVGETYDWGWVGGTDSESGDLNEYCVIFNMGYGLLKQSNGMFRLNDVTKGGSPYVKYTEDHFDSSLGRWRDFNDFSVFSYNGSNPTYPFIAGFFNSNAQSSEFHWPNGYLVRMNRGSITASDSWTIQRSLLNEVDYILPKYAPGFWISTNPSDVVIFSRASDSNLDYFDIDTVIIQGANFCHSTLVYRILDTDPWTPIKELYGDVCHPVDLTVSNNGDYAVLEAYPTTFGDGFDQSQKWYYMERLSGITCEIVRVSGSTILVRKPTGTTLTETEGTIFSSLQIFDIPNLDCSSFAQVGLALGDINRTYDNFHTIETLDFGIQRKTPLIDNHTIGGGSKISMRGNVKELIDKNVPFFNPDSDDRNVGYEYDFQWTLMSKEMYAQVLSIVNNVKYNAAPLWVINSSQLDRRVGRLCYISSPFSHQIMIDEDGKIYYNVGASLKGIE
jgi:hypothetical protein